jgi:hypothetical protein
MSSEICVELTLLWVKDDAALSVRLKRTVLYCSYLAAPLGCGLQSAVRVLRT